MKTILGFAAGGLLLAAAACNKNNDNSSPTHNDWEFVYKAAYNNLSEIDAGTLALTQATDNGVKAFAQKMVDEHGQANSELAAIVPDYHWSLPITSDSTHQAEKNSLAMLTGHAFDSAYMALQQVELNAVDSAYQKESASGKGRLKSFAMKYQPQIQQQLQMADSIYAYLKH
jgi:putative membrane protein